MIDKDKEEIILIKKNIVGDRNHYQLQIYRLCMSFAQIYIQRPNL